jgi:hypothetical protein
MLDHRIGRRHQVQRLAVVPQLAARLLAAAAPLAAGSLAAQRQRLCLCRRLPVPET